MDPNLLSLGFDAIVTELRHALREALIRKVDTHVIEPDPEPSLVCTPGELNDCTTAQRVEIAMAHAEMLWAMRIVEPPPKHTSALIDELIRGSKGLTWSSAEVGAGARPNQPYRRDKFAWCGAFAARCWGEAGLKRAIRREHCASLWRIYTFAKGTPRFITRFADVKRGNIVCIGPEGDADGAHITLARQDAGASADSLTIETVEGNASGLLPDGSRDEGVVHQIRRWYPRGAPGRTYGFRFGVRWLDSDFERNAS